MNAKAFAALAIVSALFAVPANAQTRTTPVEVKNSVSIDQTSNTVKAQQSGTWNVGLLGTPNVSVANTPNVNVTNAPTVKIDQANNTVVAMSPSKTIRPWTTDHSMNSGAVQYTDVINCSGYKHIRVAFSCSSSSPNIDVNYFILQPPATGFNGTNFELSMLVGYGTFGQTTGFANNFTQMGWWCLMDLPVMSDYCKLAVYNHSGNTVTFSHLSSIYLVN